MTNTYVYFSDNIHIHKKKKKQNQKRTRMQFFFSPNRNTTNHLLCSLAKDEQHGINNVALPAPVWSHHRRKALQAQSQPQDQTFLRQFLPPRAPTTEPTPPKTKTKRGKKKTREFSAPPSGFSQRRNQPLKHRKNKTLRGTLLTLWKGPTRCSPA